MNNKIISIFLSILFLSFSSFLNAATESNDINPETINCSYDKNNLTSLKTHLSDLQQQAVLIGQEICMSSLKVMPGESIEITERLINFANAARYEFGKIFPEENFTGVSALSTSWLNQVINPKNDYRNFSLIDGTQITSGIPPRNNLELKLNADTSSKVFYKLTQAQKAHCREVIDLSSISPSDDSKNCKNALTLWSNAVSPFQYFHTERILEKNAQMITNLQAQWKTFIEESRYQTPLDVWATTIWHNDQFKSNHLSGPPPTQLFLFHPAIVYEYLADAEKGSREDISVAIEWAGVNWWRSGFGFSVTSVYKDRKDQPSIGTGATFHIKNKYSFGYIYRDNGDDSIFFNIDLLDWFGAKEDKYNKYKAYFE